jgi:hypothetical protein
MKQRKAMNVFKENLYSISDAKALSLHLSGTKRFLDDTTALSYIPFSSGTDSRTDVARVERIAEAVPSGRPAPVAPSEPFNSWESMLKWCLEITQAKSCFVVDSQGFILMSEGEEPSEDGYEGTGANLKLALDQLRLMELNHGEIQLVDLMYSNIGVLAIQALDSDNDFFTLCFLGSESIDKSHKSVLFEQIQKSVLKLT